MFVHQRANARRIAMDEEAHVWMCARENINAFDNDVWRGIAAHPVNGKNETVRHLSLIVLIVAPGSGGVAGP
jgi:hypothetical protein